MFSLKKTLSVPTSIVSELLSPAWSSIEASFVNVTSALTVSRLASEPSVTGPLSRMVSEEVWKLIPVAAPLRMIPPVMISSSVVPAPMSMAPSVATEVTGPSPPVVAVSAAPKVTPAAARSMVRSLSR